MADIKELAISYWRMDKWLSNANVDRKMAATSALRSIKKYLDSNGIDVLDLTGQKFDSGLAVDVINNDIPEGSDDSNALISEMIKPIVMQNGAVIQFGQVSIGLSVKKQAANNPIKDDKSEASKIDDNQIIEEIKNLANSIQKLPSKKHKICSVVFSSVVVLLLILNLCLFFHLKQSITDQISNSIQQINVEEINSAHDSILTKTESLDEDISSLRQLEEKNSATHQNVSDTLNDISSMVESISGNSLSTQEDIQKLIEKLNQASQEIIDLKNTNAEQTLLIKELKENFSKYLLSGTLLFEEYTIQKNDSLSKICANKGIDLAKYGKLIQEINGIKDINIIYEGQTIILPVSIKEDD